MQAPQNLFNTLFHTLPHAFWHFPWRRVAKVLHRRLIADQLALTASSLTFTTTIALVPLITVVLAVFTAFPMFAILQTVLQQWLIESLVPDNIAKQVLGYLTQFSGKASSLGVVGVVALLLTALALILTIDRTLNNIWRVQRPRPLRNKVLIYWAVLTLGPLLLAASLAITSYLIAASKAVVGGPPGGFRFLLNALEFVMLAAGMAALFRNVPHTHVKWSHAWVGGVLVATAFEIAKKLLTLYLSAIPTYSVLYGAFATVPILLVWIYLAWAIVLVGAVLVASLPALLKGELRVPTVYGWNFTLALQILRELQQRKEAGSGESATGMAMLQIAEALHVDPVELEQPLDTLSQLDWIGYLDERDAAQPQRVVLLANLSLVQVAPLVERLLLPPARAVQSFWLNGLRGDQNVQSVL